VKSALAPKLEKISIAASDNVVAVVCKKHTRHIGKESEMEGVDEDEDEDEGGGEEDNGDEEEAGVEGLQNYCSSLLPDFSNFSPTTIQTHLPELFNCSDTCSSIFAITQESDDLSLESLTALAQQEMGKVISLHAHHWWASLVWNAARLMALFKAKAPPLPSLARENEYKTEKALRYLEKEEATVLVARLELKTFSSEVIERKNPTWTREFQSTEVLKHAKVLFPAFRKVDHRVRQNQNQLDLHFLLSQRDLREYEEECSKNGGENAGEVRMLVKFAIRHGDRKDGDRFGQWSPAFNLNVKEDLMDGKQKSEEVAKKYATDSPGVVTQEEKDKLQNGNYWSILKKTYRGKQKCLPTSPADLLSHAQLIAGELDDKKKKSDNRESIRDIIEALGAFMHLKRLGKLPADKIGMLEKMEQELNLYSNLIAGTLPTAGIENITENPMRAKPASAPSSGGEAAGSLAEANVAAAADTVNNPIRAAEAPATEDAAEAAAAKEKAAAEAKAKAKAEDVEAAAATEVEAKAKAEAAAAAAAAEVEAKAKAEKEMRMRAEADAAKAEEEAAAKAVEEARLMAEAAAAAAKAEEEARRAAQAGQEAAAKAVEEARLMAEADAKAAAAAKAEEEARPKAQAGQEAAAKAVEEARLMAEADAEAAAKAEEEARRKAQAGQEAAAKAVEEARLMAEADAEAAAAAKAEEEARRKAQAAAANKVKVLRLVDTGARRWLRRTRKKLAAKAAEAQFIADVSNDLAAAKAKGEAGPAAIASGGASSDQEPAATDQSGTEGSSRTMTKEKEGEDAPSEPAAPSDEENSAAASSTDPSTLTTATQQNGDLFGIPKQAESENSPFESDL